MADPRTMARLPVEQGAKARMAKLSPLMMELMNNLDGGVVNFCPHGCEDYELDQSGYCHHLIGFTSDRKTYEPMTFDEKMGRRVVRVKTRKGALGEDVPVPEPLQKGDKLVQITTSYRVYRKNVPAPERPEGALAETTEGDPD